MRYCTSCNRFQPGTPTFCATCGRSFGVRLCPRGHQCPTTAAFCAECGSADLSIATPRPSARQRFLHLAFLVAALALALAPLAIVVPLLLSIDVESSLAQLITLVVLLVVLYAVVRTLLPGAVRRTAYKAGRSVTDAMRRRRGRNRQ